MSKNQDLVNLKGLIEAVKICDQITMNNKDDIANFLSNIPNFSTGSLKVQALLEEADLVIDSEYQQKELPNLTEVESILQMLLQKKQSIQYTRTEMFYAPVQTKIAPSYYSFVEVPMCFFFIKLRLYQNYKQQKDISLKSNKLGDQNLLQNIDIANYGSILDQRAELDDKPVDKSDFLKKFFKQLRQKPRHYSTMEQVVTDLLLVCANCCYFNSLNPQYVEQGKILQQDILTAFNQRLGIEFPEWAQKCTEPSQLKLMMDRQKELKQQIIINDESGIGTSSNKESSNEED